MRNAELSSKGATVVTACSHLSKISRTSIHIGTIEMLPLALYSEYRKKMSEEAFVQRTADYLSGDQDGKLLRFTSLRPGIAIKRTSELA